VVRSHRSARFGWKKEMIQQAYNLCLLANSSAVVSGDCTTDEVDRLLGRQHLQILVLFCPPTLPFFSFVVVGIRITWSFSSGAENGLSLNLLIGNRMIE